MSLWDMIGLGKNPTSDLSFRDTIRATYTMVFSNWLTKVKLGALLTGISFLCTIIMTTKPDSFLAFLALLAILFCNSIFMVTVERFVLLNEVPNDFIPRHNWVTWMRSLMIFLLVMTTLVALTVVILFFLKIFEVFGAFFAFVLFLFFPYLLPLLISVMPIVRFSLIFPALALGESMTLKQSWEETKYSWFQIWSGFVMCVVPMTAIIYLFVSYITPMSLIPLMQGEPSDLHPSQFAVHFFNLITIVLIFITNALVATFFSLAYKQLVKEPGAATVIDQ